jgi:hypothetical protein
MLPDSSAAGGWTSRKTTSFTPEDLWNYIDGAAELYLAYDFQRLVSAEYATTGGDTITVDIYDMGAPMNAFGIYRAELTGTPAGVKLGSESYELTDLLAFWQGPYYVKLSAVAATPGALKADMQQLARRTAQKITDPAGAAWMLIRLPAENRVAYSEKYARVDYLGHGFLTNAVSASYQVGKSEPVTAFVMVAQDEAAAKEAFDRLQQFEAESPGGTTPVKMEGATAFTAKDSYLGNMAVTASGSLLVGAYTQGTAGQAKDTVTRVLTHLWTR